MTKGFVRIASSLTAVLVGGCSSVGRLVRQQGATRTEARLVAAGFHIQPADTADRLAELDATAPFEIVEQSRDGEKVFAYADPLRCHCQYVGDAQQYAEYKRLRDEDLTAAEERQALAVEQNVDMDVGSRGPFASPWWWWQ
jgi:hypothetical protein